VQGRGKGRGRGKEGKGIGRNRMPRHKSCIMACGGVSGVDY
jgi:hypothetical protein